MNVVWPKAVFGAEAGGEAIQRPYTTWQTDDVAMALESADSVIFAPGYGMAVGQAQHAVHELGTLLEKAGKTVAYAIHPVAGRMPGHMNVLLAEANVPYEQLKEMDEINEEFTTTDVVIVVGANDTVNPLARVKGNAISGMPILNCDKANRVVVIKRSMAAGFAGLDNDLFYLPNSSMCFGNAKDVVNKIVAAVKAWS
jgi:NAD(P) transhydrogenase subunit beta